MTNSIEQEAIFHTWRTESSNLVIKAVAGSGKTTTLLKLLEMSQYRTLFLAFNKSIQEEITARTQHISQAKAMTLHSLGLLAIRNWASLNQKHIIIRNNKNWEIIKAFESMNKIRMHRLGATERMKLYYNLMEMNDISRIFCTNDYFEIREFMKNMDKIVINTDIQMEWLEFLELRQETYEEKHVVIDFYDMIFLPATLTDMIIPIQPYNLFVDEVQDLNVAQLKVIDKLLEQRDVQRFVAVGDDKQSIYGFSGSFGQSFNYFLEKPDTEQLPLSTCYRCPVKIVEQANLVYNVMRPFKTQDGVVETTSDVESIKDSSLIICRNTAPLLNLYFNLLSKHRKVILRGEDILNSVVKLLKPYGNSKISYVKETIEEAINFHKEKENKTDFDNIQIWKLSQQLEHLILLEKAFKDSTTLKASDIVEKFKLIFEEKETENDIILCTIHKAKGLEADIVYILNENLIPSPMAKSAQQLEQERNLKYVARTRAKKEMYYLNL